MRFLARYLCLIVLDVLIILWRVPLHSARPSFLFSVPLFSSISSDANSFYERRNEFKVDAFVFAPSLKAYRCLVFSAYFWNNF